MKKYRLLIIGCLIIVSIFTLVSNTHYYGEKPSTISSAKQLKIGANEIGPGWKEESYQYMSDPVEFLEDFVNQFDETAFNPEEAKKDKERLLEMSTKLNESNVKDGSILQLRNLDHEITTGFIELDIFVFNDRKGAKKYFDHRIDKNSGTKITGFGDEAAVVSEEHSSRYIYLVQISNAFIEIVVYDEEEEARTVAEKIVEILNS
ncbi:hypothetical protein [Methanosarcina acetivorans]|uniref:DUF4367 domain-containing protein n=1 Tax=Methanosarcina acetivorans (strain ATCC 35395 / DSM 2834 / JCM 12185 / C2A) TaxID=188937 RepID=Q8TTG2_METAC|nr:hypothetical protein [Methanosarcina acetivorans]AAM03919.1 predicted protein [Methanosarcina acetivorans C2A]